MRTKPDLRIRKFVGKQVRIVYEINGECQVSVMGQLTRNRYSKYFLVPNGTAGGEYCFFDARDLYSTLGKLSNIPAFRMRNLKFAK